MSDLWIEFQALAVYTLLYPLTALAAFGAGACALLALSEVMMYATYRVLTRIGFLD